mgnify:CR=1 FL=1
MRRTDRGDGGGELGGGGVGQGELGGRPTEPAGLSHKGLRWTRTAPGSRNSVALLNARAIRVMLDGAYPLADACKAHERATRGPIRGKIVLTVA